MTLMSRGQFVLWMNRRLSNHASAVVKRFIGGCIQLQLPIGQGDTSIIKFNQLDITCWSYRVICSLFSHLTPAMRGFTDIVLSLNHYWLHVVQWLQPELRVNQWKSITHLGILMTLLYHELCKCPLKFISLCHKHTIPRSGIGTLISLWPSSDYFLWQVNDFH